MDVRVALSPLTFALTCLHQAGSNNRRSKHETAHDCTVPARLKSMFHSTNKKCTKKVMHEFHKTSFVRLHSKTAAACFRTCWYISEGLDKDMAWALE